ncbi:cardiolipin synthase ClsB [Ideonella sp. B7]|uniref:cardiolipin synthase ClsB n=1 Tax=Ideonella benzenivorans TaxID=2831643 RepID=UPI001CEC39F6|nr:cardiolipin synthase ClsB [Ideonella benzenivorans]MCA6216732.1 cardiolipin synthase ClsB [Ideonella benzenivorans]
MPPTDASGPDTPVHPGAWYIFSRPVFFGHNEVGLLRGGDELFPRLIDAIGHALHEVWLATYIFYHDDAGQAVAQALAAAARRGVRVRVVVDGFGSHHSLRQLRQWLEPAGVHLVVFRPLERWWNWFQPGQMRRLHQKLCVIDGVRGFVGGINIIDDRFDIHHGRSEHPRLDYAAELHGPVVAPVEQTLRAIWTRASFGEDWRQELLNLVRSARPVRSAHRYLRQLRILPPRHGPGEVDPAPVQAAFVVRDNMRQRRTIERALIDAIRQAERRVDLVTPYFYPGHSFRRALVKAARRGVQVRLLLQGKVDYRIAGLAARVLYDELLSEGVLIYEYMPAYLHAKMALADDEWVTVGSSNIDPLSLVLNLEANVVVRDETLSNAASREFERALTVSHHITVAPLRRGWHAVLGRGLVAWLAHWYLRLAGWNERY